ncbi:hypothetical protein SELMODRAFT_419961 [Selaginella moellendorffii]|uniref:Uncharacterized protein n=1 Tax=Selaginella moellendorffii TaxID=88036 RepID=D8SA46_SELML|nr:hypothetical protein SELMODRAFT_419961 [Selaginella moellendorffii]
MAAHNHLYPKEHISEDREVADHAIVESQQLRQAAGGSMKQWTKRLNLNLVTERLHEDLEFRTHTMLIRWIQAEKNHTIYKLYVEEINPKEQVGTAFYDQLSPWTETPCRLTTRGTRLKNKTNKDPATSVTLPTNILGTPENAVETTRFLEQMDVQRQKLVNETMHGWKTKGNNRTDDTKLAVPYSNYQKQATQRCNNNERTTIHSRRKQEIGGDLDTSSASFVDMLLHKHRQTEAKESQEIEQRVGRRGGGGGELTK